ncbi:MAG: hypothetical protein GW779_02270 [Candidatus Altiarchaeum hamiconexum]|uniref:Uncharacterized protein n=1 Tax=Candidatus Altarchaeum hamiconexum TaxID=1803513 RepID=A0A8J7YR90_9ARCH|nr:hypothetical protein [Candidatus Altarchaeum hamiconexum]OIQ04945.1 MAG: hypothetical protein AUK59_05780 [Candidatus Altarchaeum sp. CG2_30_32_3053]PIN67973.1 MAG: hypothetical protein COV98_00915 [Candidatus Altarchaeum sp. CG12_big_fil_rev_8_21_14_0_65_33_22]PIV27066.1 MAG: hypothetical protein COS36_07075 [Candidatus Altarchaeum sp. CG03_land_8_20_14_0_80_32_618]PIX49591.1 MAG: hypothetical protein COZ53_00190 [Candidatus Altarchaeum sp. CG_4_8_14_3_um_filter_33_2054]PIZ32830.1 MAG: hyp
MQFKKCNCPKDYWEEIVVDRDGNFGSKSVIYFHCDLCGEDYKIVSFDTEKILYLKQNKKMNNERKISRGKISRGNNKQMY